jgi:hypothetical protein
METKKTRIERCQQVLSDLSQKTLSMLSVADTEFVVVGV